MKNINLAVLSKRSKKKKNRIIICILLFFVLAITATGYLYSSYNKKQKSEKLKEIILANEEKLVNSIKTNYGSNVITTKETSIYSLINGEYVDVGTLASGVKLKLGEIEIDKDTLYFPTINFNNIYYVNYTDVKPQISSDLAEQTPRYKKYVPFNKNIVTNNITKLYSDGNLMYSIPEAINAPVYKIDGDRYYIEYNNALYYALKSEIDSIIDNQNSNTEVTTGIATIAYHFFYKDGEWSSCAQIICTSESLFRKQLDYLKKNDYFTPTMSEFEDWIDGRINLPKKTVMITIDDGWKTELGVEILNEYKMNATLFLITSQYPATLAWGTVEAASHSDNLHNRGDCPTGQGGGIQCLKESILLDDLSLSRSKLNNTTAFCYPFYEYNEYSISILKKAGFTMAFAGMYSNGSLKMHRGDNKFKIPRVTFLYDTDVNDLKGIL